MKRAVSSGRGVQLEEFQRKHRTGLVTLLFTDIVGSTALKQQLGDRAGATFFEKHHRIVRETLARFAEGQEIETAGDSFLITFATPSDAVQFALLLESRLRNLQAESGVAALDRIGIHVGEVVIKEDQTSAKPRDLYGIQIDTCARVMGLARAGQILMTRSVFDSARQVLKAPDVESLKALNELQGESQLEWLNHGAYLLKGLEEPLEICEVREIGQRTSAPPTSSEKAQRQVSAGEEQVLGWRPAVGQSVPNVLNTRWRLEKKLGEGGFGEVWLGRNPTTKEARVFKFCFQAERVRFLKRELTLFRVLKERVGDHPNIVRLHDVYLEQPPFYVEMDYVEGSDLRTWSEERGRDGMLPSQSSGTATREPSQNDRRWVDHISLETRLEIVAQTADALQAAHDAGVIHRDVKPSNILVEGRGSKVERESVNGKQATDDGRTANLASEVENPKVPFEPSTLDARRSTLCVKLTDFGIGQVVSEEYLKGITRAGFTQTVIGSGSSQTGTQLYMAPELLVGKAASIRSDIYSLGVVLYQLLVGDFTRPVTTDWANDISDPLLQDDLQHCFAGNPQERFAGAGQLATNLRSLPNRQAAYEERTRSERAAERRRTTALVSAGVASVLLLVAIALGYGLRRAESEAWKARQNLYAADILLAQQALEINNVGRARALLERYQPLGKSGIKTDPRGWEWRYLWQQSASDELSRLRPCPLGAHSVVPSPDGKLLAAKLADEESYQVWDLTARQLLGTYSNAIGTPFSFSAHYCAFSPDGSVLATVWKGGVVRRFSPKTLKEIAPPLQFTNELVDVYYSPDGKTLAVASVPDTKTIAITFFDTGDDRELRRVQLPRGTGLAIAPDLRMGAVGLKNGIIEIHDLTIGNRIKRFKFGAAEPETMALSPDGTYLVIANRQRHAELWDVANSNRLDWSSTHASFVRYVAFSPDGTRFATTSYDQVVKLWEVPSGNLITTLKGHERIVPCAGFMPDGQTLVTGSKDETIRFWSSQQPSEPANKHLFSSGTTPSRVWLAPAGDALLVVRSNAVFSLWNVPTWSGTEERTIPLPDFKCGAVSPGGRLVAFGAASGSVLLWDAEDHRAITKIRKEAAPIARLQLSADGRMLAVATENSWTRVWNVALTNLVAEFAHHATNRTDWVWLHAMCFSQDGELYAQAEGGGHVEIWNIGRKPPVAVGFWKADKKWVSAMAFSPDGKTIATSGYDDVVRLWDVTTQANVQTFKSSNLSSLFTVAFSPDGRRLVGGTPEGQVNLWDTESAQELLALKGHGSGVDCVSFSQDGETVVSANGFEVIRWAARKEERK